jgi:hypothetical protein
MLVKKLVPSVGRLLSGLYSAAALAGVPKPLPPCYSSSLVPYWF